MARNPLIRPRPPKYKTTTELHKSSGILDDHAVRKNVATREGTIEQVPTEDNHIVNKKFVDDSIAAIPAPVTPTLQAVTDAGATTDNVLVIPAIDDASNKTSVDVANRNLQNSSEENVIDWESYIIKAGTTNSIDWGQKYLYGAVGNIAIDYGYRQLLADGGADVILNWGTAGLADFDNSNITTTGYVTVADEAYSVSWNGSTQVPTKNAVYDEMETKQDVISFGADNQIPYTNSGTDDFDYNSKLTFNGVTLTITGAATDIDLYINDSVSARFFVVGGTGQGEYSQLIFGEGTGTGQYGGMFRASGNCTTIGVTTSPDVLVLHNRNKPIALSSSESFFTNYDLYCSTYNVYNNWDNKGYYTGAAGDCRIYYNGTDMYIDSDVVGSGSLKIGDATNNCQIKPDGEINLNGTARVTKCVTIRVAGFKAPQSNPADLVDLGIAQAYAFDPNTQEYVSTEITIPVDMDITVAPTLVADWSAAATTGTAVWQVEYLYRAEDEDVTASAQATLRGEATPSGTSNGLVREELSGFAAPSATDRVMLVRISRDTTDGTYTDDMAGDANLTAIKLCYTSNKLGTAL